jgi:hypothetical protein
VGEGAETKAPAPSRQSHKQNVGCAPRTIKKGGLCPPYIMLKKPEKKNRWGFVMKFVSSFIILFFSLVLILGCGMPSESTFTIKIHGSDNMTFSGNYMIVTSDGKSISRSVEGMVPDIYEIKGHIVSCSFQKRSKQGNLTILIVKNDQLINHATTDAAYGVVTLAVQ